LGGECLKVSWDGGVEGTAVTVAYGFHAGLSTGCGLETCAAEESLQGVGGEAVAHDCSDGFVTSERAERKGLNEIAHVLLCVLLDDGCVETNAATVAGSGDSGDDGGVDIEVRELGRVLRCVIGVENVTDDACHVVLVAIAAWVAGKRSALRREGDELPGEESGCVPRDFGSRICRI